MSQHDQLDELKERRKRVEFAEDGSAVLINDTPGVSIELMAPSAPGVDVTGLSEPEWLALYKALPDYDIVADNETKTVKLLKKSKPAKAKQDQ